ncbi:MAG: branched-chain amino acid ABC transporter permease [Candidatus Latescibacteria bacterium 4484_107]|nr:MAG: branched-chain amino acid ABC transporter permease [Candidatus Latescibacteria bacterium 4484_107]
MPFSMLLQLLLSGITIGSIYAMVALGFNIIYNATGIINFAQGEFVMLGGMIAVSLVNGLHLPIPAAFPITVLLVTLIGVAFERLCIHPLKHPKILTLVIITIAASILFKGGAMFVWGKETFSIPHFSGEHPIRFLGATILPQTLWILSIMAAVVLLLVLFFRGTMIGKAMRACAANPTAAHLVGIRVKHVVLLSFALSAAIGAVAGLIITPIALMDYERGAMLGLKGFGAAIMGGLGNFLGAVVAGLLIGILESLSAGLISSHYKDAIALVVLLAVLFIKPSGLLGRAEVSKLKEF